MARTPGSYVALAGVLLALLARPAAAQDSDRAEELIRQANDLRRQGQDSPAIPLLRQAYKLARSPRTAAQLGLAELALGYWVEAEQHLGESLAGSGSPWVDRNRKVLESSLETTRAHLGSVVVEGEPAGAQVRVNGRLAGTFPLPAPIKVAEGSVTVDVEAPAHKPESRTVEVRGRSSQHLSFRLATEEMAPVPVAASARVAEPAASTGPVTVATKPAPPPPAERPTWRRALPWTLVGTAALAGGFAVWQHVVWQKKVGDFDAQDMCGKSKAMRGGGVCSGLYDDYTHAEIRAFIGYGAAAALGAGAAALFIFDGSDDQTVGLGPGTFGLAYARRF